jgi:hypothetical protein
MRSQEQRQRGIDEASAAGFSLNESRSPRRALRTVGAAVYLGISASLLRKLRARGPSDPGDKGPDFIKVSNNVVLYEISALDAWLDARRTLPMRLAPTAQRSAAAAAR